MNNETVYAPGAMVPPLYEYPKEDGWHWFREHPEDSWRPIRVRYMYDLQKMQDSNELTYAHQSGQMYSVKASFPQQWGGKIEEPKK